MSCIHNFVCKTSRLTAKSFTPCSQFICRHFHVSQILSAEPMRKKKRIDPAMILEKEKRKLKKIDREIQKIKRRGDVPKPIDELEMSLWLRKETDIRERVKETLSFEESEHRALLKKDWSRQKCKEHIIELKAIQKVQLAQKEALNELRQISEELYQHAIQTDEYLIPYTYTGPYVTPPIENYDTPDGEYKEIVKVF